MKTKKIPDVCSFCGKPRATINSKDAGGVPHVVHPDCLNMFFAWLRAGGSKERPGDRSLANKFNRL